MDHSLILTFLLLGLGVTSFAYLPTRRYHFIDTSMNFTEAQSYCREKFTDLATIRSMEDISMLNRPAENTAVAWIGLSDDPKSWKTALGHDANSWRWSVTGQTSKTSYFNWDLNEPNFFNARSTCVGMLSDGKWADDLYYKKIMSICYDANGTSKSYVFVSTQLTWEDAQANCRKFHTDLALIENAEENEAVRSVNAASLAWIGLYRVPWTWSDGSSSTFTNWKTGEPENQNYNQHCVMDYPDGTWGDTPCSTKRAVHCHEDAKLKTIFRTKIQTDADMTDVAVNTQILQQINALLTNQGWTNFKLRWGFSPEN